MDIIDISNQVTYKHEVGQSPVSVAVNPDMNKVYVANSASDTVSVIDGSTYDIEVPEISVGNVPSRIIADAKTDTIYEHNTDIDDISVLNGSSDIVVDTIANVGRPYLYPFSRQCHD